MDTDNDTTVDNASNPEDEKEGLRRLGSSLASARKRKNFHLDYIASESNIPIGYLKSIEAGRFDSLPPGEAYTIGFLKNYANIVDLDSSLIIKNYRDCKKTEDQKPHIVIKPTSDSSFARNMFILTSILCFFVAYGVWVNFFYNSTTEGPMNQVANQNQEIIVINQDGVDSSLPLDQGTGQENEVDLITDVKDEKQPFFEDSGLVSSEHETEKILFSESVELDLDPDAISIVDESRDIYFSLKAKEDVWVELTSNEGVIFSSLMEAGKNYEFAKFPDLRLTVSNAALLEMYIDGALQGQFGDEGEVVERKIFE
jgi:cytoskeletal protein RodZ|tara:strand:- start:33 stop:971 length:939 start_codon:yes stop_codon:yes gene_type:complete